MRCYLREHSLITYACVRASAIPKQQNGNCSLTGMSVHKVLRTIDDKVGQALFFNGYCFEHARATIVYDFGLDGPGCQS